MKSHTEALHKLGACQEGCSFADQFATWQECWDAIPRGDWSLWLIGKQPGAVDSPARRKLVGVCAAIAREVLPIFERRRPDDKRVRNCIELCDRYASGDQAVLLEDLREARYAADAAAADAYAYADAAAAADAARISMQKKTAEIVRKHYPVAPTL